MSKSRSASLEQGELGISPDFNDSPHIDLEMITESELRREKERKRKREEQELLDEHEDMLKIKPPQAKQTQGHDLKKFRRSDDRNEERLKNRSHHESDRLERLERERKRLDNERHRQLDKIQKERDYEREVSRRERSGRMEEDRRRNERRDHRSRPDRDTHALDYRRSRNEPRERPTSSQSPYPKRRRDHDRRERMEERGRRVEERVEENDEESEDETSPDIEGQEPEVVEDEKVSEDYMKELHEAKEVNGGTPKYDRHHFARSKFDVEDDDDDDTTQDNNSSNNNNNKSPSPINQDQSSVKEIDEDVNKSGDDDDIDDDNDVCSDNDVNDSKIIDEEDKGDEPDLPSYYPAIQGCRSVEEFHCLNKINEGTYGVVYRAIDLKLREVVALKRLKLEKEKDGFPITSLREIKLLMMARHPNIVTIKEVVVGSNLDKVYMVMEYVEHDLKSLMESMKEPFAIGEVKTLMLQLLRGVEHLHDNWIIHRDLKTSNLLLSHSGVLKIADFGLAREYGSPLKSYTPIVVTLWYRSPELLLQTKKYSTAVDMWSVGCIFAEFLLRKPLVAGKSEIDQLGRIFKILGTPSEKIWPGVDELPGMQASTFTHHPYNQLRKKFEPCLLSDKGLKLMNGMLTYCPEKRMTADEALSHEYFTETPLPTHTSMFPTWPAKSELYKGTKSPKAPTGGKAMTRLNSDNDLTRTSNMPSQGFTFKFC